MAVSKKQLRFGIGEWFGKDFAALSAEEIRDLATLRSGTVTCPFRQLPCNKRGGVCSLRQYEKSDQGAIPTGGLVTTCPQRFKEDDRALSWIAKTLIDSNNPVVIKEVPFLKSTLDQEDAEAVGQVDMVLVNLESPNLMWCCVEMQAVYFSGPGMEAEFSALKEWNGPGLPFPLKLRRPDFRSSGPKRLMPQLQIKVPTISRWGKKMAVLVDLAFWNKLGKMTEVPHVSNCDVAWFVVDYEQTAQGWQLVPREVHFTTLDHAVEGLTGGLPVSLQEFEKTIRAKIPQAN